MLALELYFETAIFIGFCILIVKNSVPCEVFKILKFIGGKTPHRTTGINRLHTD